MRIFIFTLIYMGALLFFMGATNTKANTEAAQLTPEKLRLVQSYLTAIKAQTGQFEQSFGNSNSSSEKRHGQYWLDFPYRFRFAYAANPKTKKQQIITINKTWISIQDYAGAQANRFPSAITPLAVLQNRAKAGFALADIAPYVVAYEVRGQQTAFTLRDPSSKGGKHKIGGRLTLYFNSITRQLLGWQAVDLQNQKVQVRFFNVKYSDSLAPHLFFVQEDENVAR